MRRISYAISLVLFLGIISLFSFNHQTEAANDYPVVFVHGLNGYGEN